MVLKLSRRSRHSRRIGNRIYTIILPIFALEIEGDRTTEDETSQMLN
jgi:hypothetical protein